MTKDHSFFPADANSSVRASPVEVMTLSLIAGVILAALACALGAMLVVSKLPEAAWTAFSIGTVFGTTCAVTAHWIAARRS